MLVIYNPHPFPPRPKQNDLSLNKIKKYVSGLFKTAVTIRSRRMIKHFNVND